MGPPAASRVPRAHSPLLPTSEELLGRRAGRRELHGRCFAPVGRLQPAARGKARPHRRSRRFPLIGAVEERDRGRKRERERSSPGSRVYLCSPPT